MKTTLPSSFDDSESDFNQLESPSCISRISKNQNASVHGEIRDRRLKGQLDNKSNHIHLSKKELKEITVISGGLSPTHNALLETALKNKGINSILLPNADKKSSDIGREFGNNGLCNPAYFTTGNLIKFLKKLEAEGQSKEEIINNYVYLTAGCGDSPCRFGMYESQYHSTLENAGFKGFRILVVEQTGGVNQLNENVALNFDIAFFLMLVNVFFVGDLINAMTLSIKPYEINPAKTEQAYNKAMKIMTQAFREQAKVSLHPFLDKYLKNTVLHRNVSFVWQLFKQLSSLHFVKALAEVKQCFAGVEIDRLRKIPIVKITGEFWATITQSDGNYRIYEFLESEGVEVKTEYITTYVNYLLYKNLIKHKNKQPAYKSLFKRVRSPLGGPGAFLRKYISLYLGEKLLLREFKRLRMAIGGTLSPPLDQMTMAEEAHPYYHKLLSGGEGYMEVAKNMHYHKNNLAHMVLSVKPFGCMPSTISDGVQVKISEQFRDMIFIPIETSGDGEINAYSRIQMGLFDARTKVQEEWDRALSSIDHTIDELRTYLEENPYLKNPLYKIPKKTGITGLGPNLIYHLEDLIHAESRH